MALAVVVLMFGGTLVYAAVKNISVTDALRGLLGRPPSGNLGSLTSFTDRSTEGNATGTSTGTGTGGILGAIGGSAKLAAAVSLAQRAAALEKSQAVYTYTQVNPARTNDGNGVLSHPYSFDCSGFCGAVYKYSGLPDPYGHTGYAGTSWEVSTGGTMKEVSAAQAVPGDLVVWSGGDGHVALYIGGGRVISMGNPATRPGVALDPSNQSVSAFTAPLVLQGYYHPTGQ